MIHKLPFLILMLFTPYQIFRIIKSSYKEKKILDILVGGVIILVCATSWPINLNNWLCFSFMGLLFSIVMAYEGWSNKKHIYWLTSIILFVISGVFFFLYIDNP